MITVELQFLGDAYTPYKIPKDSERAEVKKVDYQVFFDYDEITLLQPEGVRGTYRIVFIPEDEEPFTITPEPDTLYTPKEARDRLINVISSFNTALYLAHRLFSEQPKAKTIGFNVDP